MGVISMMRAPSAASLEDTLKERDQQIKQLRDEEAELRRDRRKLEDEKSDLERDKKRMGDEDPQTGARERRCACQAACGGRVAAERVRFKITPQLKFPTRTTWARSGPRFPNGGDGDQVAREAPPQLLTEQILACDPLLSSADLQAAAA